MLTFELSEEQQAAAVNTKKQIDDCERAISSRKFSHARARRYLSGCDDWHVIIYHRDDASPTRVWSVASGMLKDIKHLFDKHGKALPLSHTEPWQ